MSYQRERDEFIARCTRESIPYQVARRLLSHATTLQRLKTAVCTGDWPADNGERKTQTCPECEGGWAPSSFRRGLCPDCRMEDLTRQTLADSGWMPIVGSDPRGAVLRLFRVGTSPEDIATGRERGVYVPPRER